MFPGLTTRLSEGNISLTTTIAPVTDVVRVTSTTTTTIVATIVPPFGGFSGIIFLQNKSGASMGMVTTGNISGTAPITVLNQRMAILVFSKLENKWSVTNDT